MVAEYPRSGGTWLARLVADATRLGVPHHYTSPVGHAAVIHCHWTPATDYRCPVVYLCRDGRDVMVSLFFHRLRHQQSGGALGRRYRRRHRKGLGELLNADRIRDQLPAFIELEFADPMVGELDWASFHERALDCSHASDRQILVRYEDLLLDAESELRAIVGHCRRVDGRLRTPREDWEWELIVRRNSFAYVTGREAGVEDQCAFRRSGTSGGWRDHFTAEAVARFDERAGGVMRRLGYGL